MKRRPTKSRQHGTMKPAAAANAAPGQHAPIEKPAGIEKPVNIEKPIYGGAFLAREQGKAIFVPLALPGEQAQVRIVEEKKRYAAAEITRITTSAPERVVAKCRHFGACGGCQYQHASYEAQLHFKQSILRETLERGGVRAPDSMTVLAAEPWEYRNRIRLALDAAGNPGYRGRRSHGLVPIAECPIAMPLLARAALAAGKIMRALAPSRRATELSLFCDAEETALLAGLSAPANFPFDDFCRALAERIPQLAGAELLSEDHSGGPPRDSRTPLAAPGKAQWGAPSLTYRAAGFSYRVDRGAFFQVNRRLVDALVDRVLGDSDREDAQGALAWDLFAGVGLFARRLASRFTRVLAVESAPSAAAALAHNLAGTGGEPVYATTLDFLRRMDSSRRGDASRAGRIAPDLIIVDPPRAGLETETTALLARIAAPALTYVSCDPATLARDLRPLLDAGYSISSIMLADLFPQTFHIETVAHLRRSRTNP